MSAAAERIEEIELDNLVPLNSLNPESREELISRSTIQRLPPGRHLFDEGDTDNMTVFLLSGQLALITDGDLVMTLKAGTIDALNPIADQQPRITTALARTCITTLSIDTDLLHKYVSGDIRKQQPIETGSVAIQELIQQALELPLLSRLPQPYKQVLRHRFELLEVKTGNVLAEAGDETKYYYLVAQGRCRIIKDQHQNKESGEYLEINVGEGFGEESLINNEPYNYKVIMVEDGKLLALSRGEFMTLIVRPLITLLSYDEVKSLDQDRMVLLDLRTPAAFQKSHMEGCVNLPFGILREVVTILDKNRDYVICGDSRQRNITAAFLMLMQNLAVKIMNQSIRKLPVVAS